jgi:hypothetical protein
MQGMRTRLLTVQSHLGEQVPLTVAAGPDPCKAAVKLTVQPIAASRLQCMMPVVCAVILKRIAQQVKGSEVKVAQGRKEKEVTSYKVAHDREKGERM